MVWKFERFAGVSQLLVLSLLERWRDSGDGDGFERHVSSVCALYEAQRDALLAAADKHLKGLAEWDTPQVSA